MIHLEKTKYLILTLIVLISGAGTAHAETLNFACEDTMDIDIVGSDVSKGDSVCVDLVFSGFDNLNSLQFSINWDPSVLKFSSLQDVNPGDQINNLIPALSFGLFDAASGNIRFIWYDPEVNGESAPDNFVVARICFQAIGAPGEETDIMISNIPLKFEAIDTSQNLLCLLDDGDETVRITLPTDLCVIAKSCASRTSNGSITVEPYGGQPPYMVNIPSIGVVGDVINAEGDSRTYGMLSPGSYTIIVTDDTGRDTTIMMEVMNEEPLRIDTLDIRYPTCSDGNNGIIEVEASGGVAPYTYVWSPISASGQTRLTRIPGDVYTVTVKDSLGCVSTATFDLAQDILTADSSIIRYPSCQGMNDGILEVSATGGVTFPGGTYNFRWTINPSANNRGTSSTNDMVGGSGYVVVYDANDCTDTIFFDLPAENVLQTSIFTDSVQCHGDSSGRVVIIADPMSMGNPPYQFLITRTNGSPVTGGSVLLNEYRHDSLWAGEFRLTLRDINGCLRMDTFRIEEPDPLDVIVVDADTSAGCDQSSNAYIEVDGSNGNGGPFTFEWDYLNSTSSRIDNLAGGNYTVTVTDRKGCESVRSFEIRGASGPVITGFDIQDVGCPGDTSGSITVLYSPGDTSIRNIAWSNGRSGENITGLDEGEYIVTITDENGCMAIDTAIVNVPPASVQITSFIIDTPSCNGAFDGFLQIMVEGGIGDYRYQWSNNTMDSVLTNIGAGRYIVAVRDESNCPPVVDTFDIPEPPAVNINVLDIQPVTCNDDTTCNGVVIAEASGGPDPSLGYNFIWTSGEVGRSSPDTARMLCKGEQLIIAANGDCVDSIYVDIPAPDELSVNFDASEVVRPSCTGFDDGSITIVPEGGTGSKRVRWDFGPTSNTLDDLPAGVYYFYVEDDNGCLYRDSVQLRDPDPLEAFVLDAASRDISCNGDQDGRIVVSWRGGNRGAASFSWNPAVSTDSVATDLGAGRYEIEVTDQRGCMDSLVVELENPASIQADFPMSDTVDCFGGQLPVTVVGATGGNGPDFTFSINNGPRRPLGEEVNLFSGNYSITVFDRSGCSIDSNITIYQPLEITVDLGPDVMEVNLGDSVTLCYQTNLTASQIQNVTWTPPGTPTDSTRRCIIIKPTDDIRVTVLIEDEDGCFAEDEILLEVDKNRRVFIPNVFNPLGNVNTRWEIFTGQGVDRIMSVQLYDRWGELIYQKEDPREGDGWDGRFQDTNEPMPNGVYIYVVKVLYLDGHEEIRRGDLTIIR